ncbi:putative phage protein (TIGR02216 family) [Rhodobium gokarnense]|uniref:Phage protein (TIGR02216 family) n=1 Tax=Rhodobium gokarnense TaxID=364296 RepID=A0ABT3HBY0_9HYPH|nr:putative phage protein (TIGR02216 family) [Rhodobium gokarnense]
MRAGLGRLKLAPDAFWRLTLPELAAALEGAFGTAPEGLAPPGRARLQRLMTLFPDTPAQEPAPKDD